MYVVHHVSTCIMNKLGNLSILLSWYSCVSKLCYTMSFSLSFVVFVSINCKQHSSTWIFFCVNVVAVFIFCLCNNCAVSTILGIEFCIVQNICSQFADVDSVWIRICCFTYTRPRKSSWYSVVLQHSRQ